jgi:hypothetical protein
MLHAAALHEVKNYVAGNKLEFKPACSYAAAREWVLSAPHQSGVAQWLG